ncbi:FAD-binding oxidoreductase [Streptomyces sp. AC555_RSS877]|uniref:FAD-binding oxidoreductase n=1 Tax=Streptomyces sp. AC555_RSS877 TaxID=2823688 RepID=UPI001C255BB4|nr:FAD-dependent oxidoreductase [Streptomyces sp. AC555_RSS877]
MRAAALRDRIGGELVLPDDAGFALARQIQNTEYDTIEPHAVAYCASERDIALCVRHARDQGLRLHVRGGGHSFNGWSTGEGLVVDLSRMNHAVAEGPVVRLGAGVQSMDALDALRTQGRQIVTGTFPTVGAGGFLTGGGIGWQTRSFGLGSDRVTAARVVLADGRTVRCSAVEEPDLYWALRGGGGGTFGVVTEFDLSPVDAAVLTGFETLWAYEDAVDVLTAWQEWAADGPDELGTSLVVLPGMFGPGGRPVVRVWGVHLGTAEEVRAGLDELAERAGSKPLSRTVGPPGDYAEVMHEALCGSKTVAQCHRTGTGPEAEGHRHPYTRQSYRLTGRAATRAESAALLDAWDPTLDASGQERYLLCIALGGAANRVPRTATAYAHRDARFLIGYQFACRDAATDAAAPARLSALADRAAAALAPLACGSYINFPSSRVGEDWETEYFGENRARLREVKRAYDPEDFFRHAQSIGHSAPTTEVES